MDDSFLFEGVVKCASLREDRGDTVSSHHSDIRATTRGLSSQVNTTHLQRGRSRTAERTRQATTEDGRSHEAEEKTKQNAY